MFGFLVPVKKYERLTGCFEFPHLTVASAHASDILPLSQLAGELKKIGKAGVIVKNTISSQLIVRRKKVLSNPEEYKLIVSPDRIEIISASAPGAYYGLQTLRELIHIHGKKIPCCHIHDWPTLARRGVYLDCSRGKVPKVSTLKALIERLSSWKINELQLYIENTFMFRKHPDIGKGFSPFTPRDILKIQTYCKEYHIRFVPSLASFGHMEKILMLPKYTHLAEVPGGTTLCPGDPGSIKLLADMYSEFLPLFEADDFNICGDEPWELGKGRSKHRVARIGINRVYLEFILKIRKLCLKYGKRMNMWSDIVLKHPEMIPLLPKDIVMLNWDYFPKGKCIPRTQELADAGFPFMCCPGTNAWRSHGSRLQQGIDNVSIFARVAAKYGAEGLLNTDWGDGGHRNTLAVSLCSFAHGAAHAWNTKAVDDKKHIQNFTFHTFGDCKGRLADALRVLGHSKEFWPYYALIESLTKAVPSMEFYGHKHAVIDTLSSTPEQIEHRIQALVNLSWPEPDKTVDYFEAVSLEEFALACEMERLAHRRVQLRRAIRNNRVPAVSDLRSHADEIQAMSENFARLWRIRNRPSCLSANIAAFRAVVSQVFSLV